MTQLNTIRTLSALTIAASLAACGGGGGSSAPAAAAPAAPAAPVTVVSTAGSLNAAAIAPSYAASSVQMSAFQKLNELRKAAGAGELEQSTQLDTAAQAHAQYLSTNQTVTHVEDANLSGFYAVTPEGRATKAGYTGNVSEDIGGTGASMLGSDCSIGLLNTVYHGDSLLYTWSDVGVGTAPDAANFPMCVYNVGTKQAYGQVRPAGALMAYPYAGQTGIEGTFYIAYESPRPLASEIPGTTAGSPILVSVKNADYENFRAAGTLDATLTKFELKDAGGNLVPAVVMVSTSVKASGVTVTQDSILNPGSVILVPRSPLSAMTTYSVSFAATLKAGTSLTKDWTFTTK